MYKFEFPHGDRTDRFGISDSLPNQFARDIFNEIVNRYDLSKEDAERILEFMKDYKPHEYLHIDLNSSNTLVVFTEGEGDDYGFGCGIALREGNYIPYLHEFD